MEPIKTFDRLVYNLTLGPGYEGYKELIRAVEPTKEELDRFCQWNKDHYQRLRIYDTEGMEAILTCWESGQAGPIHNYGFQQGWIKIIKGELRLEYFNKAMAHPEAYNTKTLKVGEYAYLNDSLGYHRFMNEHHGRTIALHLYSDKIVNWEVLDEDTGAVHEEEPQCDKVIEI